MKKKLAALLKNLIFILCILGMVLHLQRVTVNKSQLELPASYFKTDEKTDVILLGASTVTFGLYPMELWSQYGYTSFNLGTGEQSFGMSYYLLKEALERNRPKLVVLDCGRAYRDETTFIPSHLHWVTDTMPLLSKNRLAMIRDLGGGFTVKERMALYMPLLRYHVRWEELTKRDFETNEKEMTYGAKINSKVNYDGPYAEFAIDTKNALGAGSMEYLERIIDLCRQNDTDLLLVTIPLTGMSEEVSQETYQLRVNAAYAMEAFAAERGVPYLNLIDKAEAIGIDPEADSQDGLHLNYSGSTKLTDYIGTYIRDHYDVKDHRDEAGYESFREDYEAYLAYMPEGILKTVQRLDVYLDWLKMIKDDERYTIIIANAAGNKLDPFADYRDSFAELGIRTDFDASSLTVIDRGEVIEQLEIEDLQTFVEEGLEYHYINDERGLMISLKPEEPVIMINRTNYIKDQRGFYIVVYDRELNDLTDSIGIDTTKSRYTIRHYSSLNYRYK
ncbi:MAG: hypothetical protein K6G61_00610 [Solobacterium sp.]|nr:hypothetical protein [Solobacterium sp.]